MTINNEKLYELCKKYGAQARFWRQKFIGLLPEVMRRELYLQHGMSSIYEFAAKLACISRETVNEVLRIHQHLETAPLLQEKLVSGEIGYTKLRAIATIVKPETQELWLEKVESMSKPTLEVYVQELKKQAVFAGLEQSAVGAPGAIQHEGTADPKQKAAGTGLPGKEYDFVPFSVKVKSQTLAKMRVMKDRLEKKLKKPMNWEAGFSKSGNDRQSKRSAVLY